MQRVLLVVGLAIYTVLINNWLIVGKLGQGMRSCKCTVETMIYKLVCASDNGRSVCMPRCVCLCV